MTNCDIIQVKRSGGTLDSETLLTSPCGRVTEFGAELRRIATDLVETMESQPLAVGLAAPQVGVALQVAVVSNDDGSPFVVVNPEIISASGKKDLKRESCMSIWGMTGGVERRSKVAIRFQDLNGDSHTRNLSGFAARIAQHEIDHLGGILFQVHVKGGLQRTDIFDPYSPNAS